MPNIQGRNDVRVHDDAVIDYCLARLLETNDGGEECLDKQLAPGCQIVEVPLEAMGLHSWGVLGAHPPPLTARTHARTHARTRTPCNNACQLRSIPMPVGASQLVDGPRPHPPPAG